MITYRILFFFFLLRCNLPNDCLSLKIQTLHEDDFNLVNTSLVSHGIKWESTLAPVLDKLHPCVHPGTPSELKRVYLNIIASLKDTSWLSAICLHGFDSVLKALPRKQSPKWILTYRMFLKAHSWD